MSQPSNTPESANSYVLARLLEGQLGHARELAELRASHARELGELRTSHARELSETRTAHAAAMTGIEEELRRHREAESTQADVVKSYAASLEADRKALAELKAAKEAGRAGLLTLFADPRVIPAIVTIIVGIAAYFVGASNGATASPP